MPLLSSSLAPDSYSDAGKLQRVVSLETGYLLSIESG